MDQLGVALAKKGPDQALEGSRQGRIGDVTLVLVELARGKNAAGRNKHLVKLIDDGRLADTRISGNEHQFRRAARDDAVEGSKQSIDLARSPVQFLRDQEPVWGVVFAQREFVDAALGLPFNKAAPKITLSA